MLRTILVYACDFCGKRFVWHTDGHRIVKDLIHLLPAGWSQWETHEAGTDEVINFLLCPECTKKENLT